MNVVLTPSPSVILNEYIAAGSYSRLAILVDENTLTHCYPLLTDLPAHHVLKIGSGEDKKNLETCVNIWQQLTNWSFDRHSLLIVLGGGVLCDMGGFCAATFKRGIPFIFVPTTLLAQVDASIGGKVGVDFHHLKNHIGVFQEPVCTIISRDFLDTLPANEWRSGFGEVIKHVLISDASLWDELKKTPFSQLPWERLIKHSIELKQHVAEKDPRENGLRKILNAGHTVGHALETYLLTHDRPIPHGEAIAVGLIAEASIAAERNMLTTQALEEIARFIVTTFGKQTLDPNGDDSIISLASQDKKNKGGKILGVLLDGIGKAQWDIELSVEELKNGLNVYRDFQI